ncbi:unnamed protein product, partial [Meganyctiphanes norvegica]
RIFMIKFTKMSSPAWQTPTPLCRLAADAIIWWLIGRCSPENWPYDVETKYDYEKQNEDFFPNNSDDEEESEPEEELEPENNINNENGEPFNKVNNENEAQVDNLNNAEKANINENHDHSEIMEVDLGDACEKVDLDLILLASEDGIVTYHGKKYNNNDDLNRHLNAKIWVLNTLRRLKNWWDSTDILGPLHSSLQRQVRE